MALSARALAIGDSTELALVENLTRTQIVQYAGASGDYNPLHTDEVFAREVAHYPTVFAHGMLTMGMTGRVLTDWVGDGRLLSYGARFVRQVWPGDTLVARARGDRHPGGGGPGRGRPGRVHAQPGGRRGARGDGDRPPRSLTSPGLSGWGSLSVPRTRPTSGSTPAAKPPPRGANCRNRPLGGAR